MIHTLPSLDSRYAVDTKHITYFRQNGHVLLEGILDEPEVNAYRKVINRAAAKMNTETRRMEDRDTYGKAFLQIMNLWLADEDVRAFTLSRRFAQIAADLLGVNNVRIYHDQALFKEPGGGPTPWHQDQYYWPIDTMNTVTMWMPLVPIAEAMGMLTFASGSQTKGRIFNTEISDESEQLFDDYVKKEKFAITRATQMNAGDATFHYGCTIHNAPGNASDIMREVMTIIYVADGAKVSQPTNSWQENDRQKWLEGFAIGSEVGSKLNPKIL